MRSASESSSASQVTRISKMLSVKRVDPGRTSVLYFDEQDTNTSRLEWQAFVCRRRLNWDSLCSVVEHEYFLNLVGVFLCLNGMYTGYATDSNVRSTIERYNSLEEKVPFAVEVPAWQSTMDMFFASIFTVEILMRILGEELAFFFGPQWGWNMLDSSLVVASLTELVLATQATTSTSWASLRLWRVSRPLRSVRIIRYFVRLRKFRMLLLAVHHSMSTLLNVCLFIFMILCVSSVVFLDGVSDYIASGRSDAAIVDTLQSLFGAFELTWLTLFMSITGGLSWEVALNAMFKVHPIYGMLFVLFIASMMLAALNIVAGIFVNDAIEMAQKDRDYALHSESVRNKEMIAGLKELFLEFDTDQSGTLTLAEFMEAWNHPDVLTRFRLLGVEFLDTQNLFEMLDISKDEALAFDEFISFCLHAKALTRPVDLHSFLTQHKRDSRWLHVGLSKLERQIDKLGDSINNISKSKHVVPSDGLFNRKRSSLMVPNEPAASRPHSRSLTYDWHCVGD